MIRTIKWIEAYRGMRNEGCDVVVSTFIACLWWAFEVKVEE